jgi:predicted O-methyltransferase YrrM
MMLIKKGGIIVLDNMLWSGQVLDPKDDDSIALNKTAEHINNDNRVFNHMLTIRDGLMVCIKNG